MENEALLEYYQKMERNEIKLEYLKMRVKLGQLYQELDRITDEHWRAAKAAEIEAEEAALEIIDRVWFFRYKEHIPFEAQE